MVDGSSDDIPYLHSMPTLDVALEIIAD